MDASEVQRLRTAAERAFAAGRHQQALAQSIRLERAQPDEPSWARYTALVCQAMGRTPDQIDALDRAAERHARRGEVLKAAAICKHILALDPEHPATRQRLGDLRAAHARSRPDAGGRPAARLAKPRIPSGALREGPESGLRGLPLRQVMPGAARAGGASGRSGVYAIPLEDEPEASIGSVLDEASRTQLASGASVPQVVPTAPRGFTSSGRPPGEAGGSRPVSGVGSPMAAEDAAVLAVAEELRAAQRTERALTDTPLFREMPADAFHALIDRAELRSVARDADVFRQGAPGDALYVIAEGEVGVIDEGPPRRGLSKLGEGDFFGEMALVANQPRTATCTALTDVELIAIDRPTLQGVLRHHPEVLTVLLRFFRDRSIDRVLRTSPVFAGLSSHDRAAVRPFFRFLEVDAGATLIEEGGRPEGLLVLLAGRAEAVRASDGGRLGVLLPGDLAGEMSLVHDRPASATVRAIEKLLAVEFPAPAFRKILAARPDVRAYVEGVARNRAPSFPRPP